MDAGSLDADGCSGQSSSVRIVGEATHATARDDMERLLDEVDYEERTTWLVTPRASVLTEASPQLDFGPTVIAVKVQLGTARCTMQLATSPGTSDRPEHD